MQLLQNRLMDNTLTENEMLVLITAIRKVISGSEEPPITEILETNILTMISQLLRFADTSDELKVMKVRHL